ncbi:hypothetical protein M0811_08112 [Anaeramoeba ignava]|uniref:PAS domain-containing protein n=1 Tax=Anaeramoeba ignava TaxID=1746090 RepID=A0A9Q0RC42_ANAIG|nr:hypothetical protein M0811_08112 [Anaeramoeba ignava]
MGNVFTDVQVSRKITKKNLKRYYKMVDSSIEAIILVNQKGECVYVNQPYCQMMGAKSKDSIIHTNAGDFSPPTQKHLNMESLPAAILMVKTTLESKTGTHDFDWYHIDCNKNEFLSHVWTSSIDLMGEFVVQAIVRKLSLINDPYSTKRPPPKLHNQKIDFSSEESLSSKHSSDNLLHIVNIEQLELEHQHCNTIEQAKDLVRDFDNLNLEQKIIPLLNQAQDIFKNYIKIQNEQILFMMKNDPSKFSFSSNQSNQSNNNQSNNNNNNNQSNQKKLENINFKPLFQDHQKETSQKLQKEMNRIMRNEQQFARDSSNMI